MDDIIRGMGRGSVSGGGGSDCHDVIIYDCSTTSASAAALEDLAHLMGMHDPEAERHRGALHRALTYAAARVERGAARLHPESLRAIYALLWHGAF
jgi:hypothetical protein